MTLALHCSLLLPAGPAMQILWGLCKYVRCSRGSCRDFPTVPLESWVHFYHPSPYCQQDTWRDCLEWRAWKKERKVWGITITDNVKVLENFITQIRMCRRSILIVALRLTCAPDNGIQPTAPDAFWYFLSASTWCLLAFLRGNHMVKFGQPFCVLLQCCEMHVLCSSWQLK